ncbi:MAG: hypothetical protein ACRCU1_02795 [Alsobacter sp.]
MSKFRKTNSINVMGDLRAFADYLEKHGDEGERADAAEQLNRQLDQLLECDAFGTEGQIDPRGDHRG